MRILIFVLFLLGACAMYPREVLEKRDAQFFDVDILQEEGACQLKVSGLAFKSAMAVERVEAKKIGKSELNILIHLTQAKKGMSGRFSEVLIVPQAIQIVTFGDGRVPIWRRSEGCD